MRDFTGQRTDHDGGRVDHQRAFVAFGIFDQESDGLAAATARHVFIGCRTHKARVGQRFARTARGSVPATTGTAGDQKVYAVKNLMPIGHGRAGKSKGCNSRCNQGAAAQF